MLYSVTLTKVFKVKLFKWLVWQVNARKCKHSIAIRYEVKYLPSNGAAANVVNHDRDLHFQGLTFLKWEYLENDES